MKQSIAILMCTALVGFVAVGCANKNKPTADASVMDVSTPAQPGPSAYTPAPQPIAAQPVTYDTMPNNNNFGGGSTAGAPSGPYTVKKGDTLYSIARTRYGDGKQWQKITAANPGLRPESLKVGQTITVP
ncbi:MAG: LysM peptidoglycan-binding domain-containing protein [Anaerolineae bacterium]|nr:LysM peptidoglycan-binding domain-containing protein [Phycisphaerae bacterium]